MFIHLDVVNLLQNFFAANHLSKDTGLRLLALAQGDVELTAVTVRSPSTIGKAYKTCGGQCAVGRELIGKSRMCWGEDGVSSRSVSIQDVAALKNEGGNEPVEESQSICFRCRFRRSRLAESEKAVMEENKISACESK